MDIITINSPFDKDEFIKENLFRLKLVLKPMRRRCINVSISTGLFLLSTLGLYIANDQYLPFLIVTIIFGAITFILVHSFFSSKRKYLKQTHELALKYIEEKLNPVFEINDDGIYYSDAERTINLKWSNFKYFSLCSDYIIITAGKTVEDAYFFARHEFDKQTFDNFLVLLANKLPQKTLKI